MGKISGTEKSRKWSSCGPKDSAEVCNWWRQRDREGPAEHQGVCKWHYQREVQQIKGRQEREAQGIREIEKERDRRWQIRVEKEEVLRYPLKLYLSHIWLPVRWSSGPARNTIIRNREDAFYIVSDERKGDTQQRWVERRGQLRVWTSDKVPMTRCCRQILM